MFIHHHIDRVKKLLCEIKDTEVREICMKFFDDFSVNAVINGIDSKNVKNTIYVFVEFIKSIMGHIDLMFFEDYNLNPEDMNVNNESFNLKCKAFFYLVWYMFKHFIASVYEEDKDPVSILYSKIKCIVNDQGFLIKTLDKPVIYDFFYGECKAIFNNPIAKRYRLDGIVKFFTPAKQDENGMSSDNKDILHICEDIRFLNY